MILSAFFMAILGATASFLPQEIAAHFGARADFHAVLLLQIVGALYLGFAILNWMAKDVLIGGIYSRPLALGNFLHFAVVSVVLLKAIAAGFRAPEILVATAIYSFITLGFGRVLFTSPSRPKQGSASGV